MSREHPTRRNKADEGGVRGPRPRRPDVEFTGARTFEAHGARVGLVTCKDCGAAILVDPSDTVDYVERHRRKHRAR